MTGEHLSGKLQYPRSNFREIRNKVPDKKNLYAPAEDIPLFEFPIDFYYNSL